MPTLVPDKAEAIEAAWRTATLQFEKGCREPIIGLISRHLAPGDEGVRAKVAEFLGTEFGAAIFKAFLSLGLAAVPAGTPVSHAAEMLAKQLRVGAMADMGDMAADVLMGPLRQVMALYLQGAPGLPQLPQAPATTGIFDEAPAPVEAVKK